MTDWDSYGFIDESGTAGATVNANEFLTLSLVIFRDIAEMKSVHEKYAELRRNLGRSEKYEFHYVHNKMVTRKKVFNVIAGVNFEFITFVVGKDRVKGHASYATLAEMIVDQMSKRDGNIKITIDTNPVLFKELNKIKKAKNLKNMRFQQADSAMVDCLQLTDYVVGAHSKIIRGKDEENFKKIRKKLKLTLVCRYD